MYDGQKTSQPALGGSGVLSKEITQSLLAFRVAAIIMIVSLLVRILSAVLIGSVDPQTIIPSFIDVILIIGLLRFRPWARTWVLIRAVLGAVLWPLLMFLSYDLLSSILMTVAQWGYCGALILVLTGETKTWRIAVAVAIFAVFFLTISCAMTALVVLALVMEVPLTQSLFEFQAFEFLV